MWLSGSQTANDETRKSVERLSDDLDQAFEPGGVGCPMKAEQRTVFVARDGRDFPTKAKCLAHERETCGAALVGLTEAQVEAARTWADPELAEAFEMFGYQTAQDAPGRRPVQTTPAAERARTRPRARRSALEDGRE